MNDQSSWDCCSVTDWKRIIKSLETDKVGWCTIDKNMIRDSWIDS